MKKTLELRIRKYSALLIVLFFFSSCHLLYLPNNVHVPMLSQSGDFSANIGTGSSYTNLQAAYSPTTNLGVMMNLSFGGSADENTSNENKFGFGEIGIGYYNPLSKAFLFDFYGGYGVGLSETYENSLNVPTTVNGMYSRLFLQPSITLSAKDVLDLNFAIRPTLIFMKTNSNVQVSNVGLFVEPALTLKYGWKHFKIINQVGLSLPLNAVNFGFNPFILNVGISYQFKSKWKNNN